MMDLHQRFVDRWFTAFEANPVQTVADTFLGRFHLGPYTMLDRVEILRQLKANKPEMEERIDTAMWAWFADKIKPDSCQASRWDRARLDLWAALHQDEIVEPLACIVTGHPNAD